MTKSTSMKPTAMTLLPLLGAIVAWALSACAVPAGKLGEVGTLHAGEVVQVMTRNDIMANREVRASLVNAGARESSIVDGSVVVVRLLCCGPPNVSNPKGLFNPQGLSVNVGDVVEFLWPGGTAVNTVTRVLQRANQNDGACWWDPRNDKLWRRVMYCDWMPKEGWVKQEGLITGWYKPAM